MGKQLCLVTLALTLWLRFVFSEVIHPDNCVLQNNSEDLKLCTIKIVCPENTTPSDKMTEAINKKVSLCDAASAIEITIDMKMNIDELPDLSPEIWTRVKTFIMNHADLKVFPEKLENAKNIESINLAHNQIQTIKDFDSFPNLKRLDLSYNLINTSIDITMFKKLNSINFSNNRITELKFDITDEDIDLVDINLSKNQIHVIPELYFENCSKLNILNLSSNAISEISIKQVHGLVNLAIMDLSHNQVQSIGHEFFKFEHLNTLLLDFNKIESISGEVFSALKKLKHLNLASNSINFIDENAFNHLINLEDLYLGHNYLTNISKKMFEKNTLLVNLDVSFNKISVLEPGCFKNSKIKELNLGNNHLEGTLDSSMFEGLQISKLDLSGGAITELGENCFCYLQNIQSLNLMNNTISIISETAFKNLTKLNILDLSQNMITNLKFLEFGFDNVEYLNASSNEITTIENNTFKNTKTLRTLDLSYNRIKKLEGVHFDTLQNISSFKCAYCRLANISKETFSKAIFLNILDLSHNSLLDSEFLNDLSVTLKDLNISNNNFENIDSIKKLVNINTLDCGRNNISNLSVEVFTGYTSLKSINLSFNYNLKITSHLKGIKTLNEANLSNINDVNFENSTDTSITALDLSSIGLKDLNSIHLNNINGLQSLILQNNHIFNLTNSSFSGLKSLKMLDLNGNSINNLESDTFKDLKQLEKLNLSNNEISFLGKPTFTYLNKLKLLDLSNNKMNVINETIFDTNQNLKDLDLHGNSISFIIIKAFQFLKNLKTLILRQNMLTDFGPYHVPGESKEIDIDVDNNKIKDMRFQEFSEQPINSLSIRGNPIPCVKVFKAEALFLKSGLKLYYDCTDSLISSGLDVDVSAEKIFVVTAPKNIGSPDESTDKMSVRTDEIGTEKTDTSASGTAKDINTNEIEGMSNVTTKLKETVGIKEGKKIKESIIRSSGVKRKLGEVIKSINDYMKKLSDPTLDEGTDGIKKSGEDNDEIKEPSTIGSSEVSGSGHEVKKNASVPESTIASSFTQHPEPIFDGIVHRNTTVDVSGTSQGGMSGDDNNKIRKPSTISSSGVKKPKFKLPKSIDDYMNELENPTQSEGTAGIKKSGEDNDKMKESTIGSSEVSGSGHDVKKNDSVPESTIASSFTQRPDPISDRKVQHNTTVGVSGTSQGGMTVRDTGGVARPVTITPITANSHDKLIVALICLASIAICIQAVVIGVKFHKRCRSQSHLP